jgi:hypothetical protein
VATQAPNRKKHNVEWTSSLVVSEVEAHPDLLSIPTFVLFVQKDELQMSRAEVRKEDRLEAQKEFEKWLSDQTAPRQAPPKKQMQNEESLAPVDDKERSAVAVRAQSQNGGPKGISRPSSDGFRPRAGARPNGPQGVPQPRAWNSQRGPQREKNTDTTSPPRQRATTMADSLNPANYADTPASPFAQGGSSSSGPAGRSPTRKTPTPRPGANGRPKTPTPRGPSSSSAAARRRPPSARKENGSRNGHVNARPASGAPPNSRPAPGSSRSGSSKPGTRKTPRATPRRERPGSGGPPPGSGLPPQPVPVS